MPEAETPPADTLGMRGGAVADDVRSGRLPLAAKAVYGSGQLVDGVIITALNTFLFFYLTEVCGLSGGLTGLSLFVAMLVDGVGDPLVGALSDGSWSKWGRRHPFLLGSALPAAVGLGLMFSIPTALPRPLLFAYVTVISVALRIAHSNFNLPFVALGAELTDDYRERTAVVASRFFFNVLANFATLSLGFLVFMSGPNGLLNRAAYAPFGWSCALIVLIGGYSCAFGTLSSRGRMHRVSARQGSLLLLLLRDVGEIFRNRTFRLMFVSLLLLFTGFGTFTTLSLHANKFFWKLPSGVIQVVSIVPVVGLALGAWINTLTAARLERLTAVIVGLVLLTATQAVWPVLRVMHLLPGGEVLYAILMVNAVVAGAANSFIGVSLHSMMADAADEHELLFGTRREGLLYAGLNLSAKAATGLGALVSGLALDLIHFPTGIASKAADQIHIPAETLTKLGLVYGPGAAAITLISTLTLAGYGLNKRRHSQILNQLKQEKRDIAAAG